VYNIGDFCAFFSRDHSDTGQEACGTGAEAWLFLFKWTNLSVGTLHETTLALYHFMVDISTIK